MIHQLAIKLKFREFEAITLGSTSMVADDTGQHDANPASAKGFDRYAHANNPPIIYADPNGHMRILAIVTIGKMPTIFFAYIIQ